MGETKVPIFARKEKKRHFCDLSRQVLSEVVDLPKKNKYNAPGGGYSRTLPIRVCAAQRERGRDFEAPGLERGIHFRGVF